MSGVEGAESGGDCNNAVAWFLYTGQPAEEIPRDITHARIDPSVKKIGRGAFGGCEQLEMVELCEGVERIEAQAFYGCKSLKCMKVPSTVNEIGPLAFYGCEQLVEVELCDGLEHIGPGAFNGCKSLKRMKIPSTVRDISGYAFFNCDQLVVVELSEGLKVIGERAFSACKSLTRTKVPSTVREVGEWAFFNCKQLVEVELCDGIEKIGQGAFELCVSLTGIKVPSSVKMIGEYTFCNCEQFMEVGLCEGLEEIGESAFGGCKSLKLFKVPCTVKKIGPLAFSGCEQLVGVELCEGGLQRIERSAFSNCFSLRNVALPPDTQAFNCFGGGCYDFLKLFGSHEMIHDELKSRFDGLPVNKLCYLQSYYPTDVIIDQLNIIMEARRESSLDESGSQDCLGMTPLHILACSTKHNLDLYQFIVTNQPISLITEDKWGYPPMLYAIWGEAPRKIVQFLVAGQKSAFPSHVLDWDKMIETLCRDKASLHVVTRLLDTQQESFPDHSVNWQKAAKELAIRFFRERDYTEDWTESFFGDWGAMMDILRSSRAHKELIRSLLEMQVRFFAVQKKDLQIFCEEFTQPLTGWWWNGLGGAHNSMRTFHFLVKCNVVERLDAVGVRKWRMDIKDSVERLSSGAYNFDHIHSKLVTYEREYAQLKDAAFLLELALWKTKIVELDYAETADLRGQCRINCGADIIIPNVLPYLILGEEQHTASDEDDGDDESSGEGHSGMDDSRSGEEHSEDMDESSDNDVDED